MVAALKTLQTYLVRQIVASLALTVGVFTFVLLLGNALKEILPLLVNGLVRFSTVAQAIGLLVPFVWVFALPMGLLTATLLIFGRFSADQELTATRASGISLLSLVSPVLLLSLLLCALSALINLELGPRCRVAYKDLILRLKVEIGSVYLPEGRFITEYTNHVVYIGKNRNGQLQDVLLYDIEQETTASARRGKYEIDEVNKQLNLTLRDGSFKTGKTDSGNFEEVVYQFDLRPAQKVDTEPAIDDMTFSQLCAKYQALNRLLDRSGPVRQLTREQLASRKAMIAAQRRDLTTPVLFQLHRQVAFSFACFGFTLLGIPLGIRVHRRETNIGIAIALLLVAVYYSFIMLGQALDTRPECYPYLIVWLPNFLFQAVGAVLLWRANRGI